MSSVCFARRYIVDLSGESDCSHAVLLEIKGEGSANAQGAARRRFVKIRGISAELLCKRSLRARRFQWSPKATALVDDWLDNFPASRETATL